MKAITPRSPLTYCINYSSRTINLTQQIYYNLDKSMNISQAFGLLETRAGVHCTSQCCVCTLCFLTVTELSSVINYTFNELSKAFYLQLHGG